jgi:hypothetical protein
MPRVFAGRPDNHHHSISKKSDRLEARLTIIPACILHSDCRTGKDDRRIGKVQTAVIESGFYVLLDRT